jgi:EAL domain-containing protein (putative c-di-GMP-specific phosphodiesterase class I)
VLEVHEWAIGNLVMMGELKSRLRDLDVGLAYDDFGAGHARLLELGEVPPDFLKFDIRFIHAIDQAPASRARLLRSLVGAAQDLGVKTIAEGVETQAQAEALVELGCAMAQGYHLGRPVDARTARRLVAEGAMLPKVAATAEGVVEGT